MKKILITTVCFLLISAGALAGKNTYTWDKLADGLDYTSYTFSQGEDDKTTLHAFSIDPKKFRFDILLPANEQTGASAEEFAKKEKALLIINGGFFTPEHKSIGLIIKNGKEINPIHNTSWWSIFTLSGDKPFIYTPKDFKDAKDVGTALQVGPRLVIDGVIPKLKVSMAARSAVGITKDGKVIIAITQGSSVSMNEIARRMSSSPLEGGLGCPNAMALDGGSSSQLYAKVKKFTLNLPGFARVTNALAVFPK